MALISELKETKEKSTSFNISRKKGPIAFGVIKCRYVEFGRIASLEMMWELQNDQITDMKPLPS